MLGIGGGCQSWKVAALLSAVGGALCVRAAPPSAAASPFAAAATSTAAPRLEGRAAFGDWRADSPGLRRLIRPADLPAPYATPSSARPATVAAPPPGASLKVPAGFVVQRYLAGLENPRALRTAPNGDIFVAESDAGRIRVIRPGSGATPARVEVYAAGLHGPFGMGFYPSHGEPQWFYVATRNQVWRYAYRSGDLKARAAPELLVSQLAETTAGHATRDLLFTADDQRLLVSVGSESNVAADLPRGSAALIGRTERERGLGAAWGSESHRADVLAFSPTGRPLGKAFATGIRNCVGMTRQPATGEVWCVTNERDGRGDDLVPDYATRVREGQFYGWPWFYTGSNVDPEHRGERPDLSGKVQVPDVLFQAHSAALGITFYTASSGAAAFPEQYRGDAFVALHGSWNRSQRTGYKIVRLIMVNGQPTGEYEDFMTGFVIDEYRVWGRPVGVTVMPDGALLVSDDAGGALWRVSYKGR